MTSLNGVYNLHFESYPSNTLLILQYYKYTQRPAALARAVVEAARKGDFPKVKPICGQPIGYGGRAMPTLTPPFPMVIPLPEPVFHSSN